MASRQKEEDNAVLDKYTKQDDSKVKELNLAVENITKRVVAATRSLEEEVTETQSVQIQLDKTAEDFKQLHTDRQVKNIISSHLISYMYIPWPSIGRHIHIHIHIYIHIHTGCRRW